MAKVLATIICCAIVYAKPVLVVNEVLALNVNVEISIDVVEEPLYSALTPDVPEEPELPLVPEEPEVPSVPEVPLIPLKPDVPELPSVPLEPLVPELPEVPASVLLSKLLVVSFQTTTWSEVLPLGTTKTFIPLRATNSFAIVFFFHFPKEKFFYVY